MKKRSVLLTALLICCCCQMQVNAKHQENIEPASNQEYESQTDVNGGALYTQEGYTTSVTESKFNNNTASQNGGAVYNAGEMTVGGTFTGNKAQRQGGAVYNSGSLTVKEGSTFENNSAQVSGGAISNYGKNLTIEDNVTFKGNKSLLTGPSIAEHEEMGAVYSEGTTDRENKVQIGDGVTFENNKAAGGAGLYLYGNNDASIGDNATFKGNSAEKSAGGAITLVDKDKKSDGGNGQPRLSIGDNAKFEGNTAQKFGGAISVNADDAELTIGKNAKFTENTVTNGQYGGGAIYNQGTTDIGEGAVFDGNRNTTDKGIAGAIFNSGNMGTIKGATFSNNEAKASGGAVYTFKPANSDNYQMDFESSKFLNNKALDGGAIFAAGDVNITDSIFEGNEAGAAGGAIYNIQAQINIANSTFTNNTAKTNGGAIFNYVNTVITNSTFTGNNADKGGALYNYTGKTMTAEGTFENNTADYGGAAYNAGKLNDDGTVTEAGEMNIGGTFKGNKANTRGGALYNGGNLTVKDGSTFENNSASEYDGGAIYNAGSSLTIGDNVTFKNNTSIGGDVPENTQYGGAIESEGTNARENKVQIGDGVTFENNKSMVGGGLSLSQRNNAVIGDNATFKGNTATNSGGAISMYNLGEETSSLKIGDNALFEGNKAGTETTNAELYSVYGGAISLLDSGSESSTVEIGNNAVFLNNTADADSSYGYGGAIYNTVNLTIGDKARFEGNTANYMSGAIYNHKEMEIGSNSVFKDNKVTDANSIGGAIYNDNGILAIGENALFESNSANHMGGAICNYAADLTLGANSVFTNNKTTDSSSLGGAIYNTKVVDIGENSVFDGNSTAYMGGAIFNYGGDLTLGANSVFKNNKATGEDAMGGAIYNTKSMKIGENAVFDGNTAADRGGAIFNYSGEIENQLTKATFLNNSADSGGAVYAHTSKLGINDSVFYKNSAKTDGGGLYAYADVDVENSLFEDNSSASKGGAIYNITSSKEHTLTVNKSQFSNNKAMVGGAIAASGAKTTTTVTDSSFSNNSVTEKKGEDGTPTGGQGGAIWTGASAENTLTVSGSAFEGNTSEAEGGAIWSGGKTDIQNSVFSQNKSLGKTFSGDKPDYSNDNEGGGAIFIGSSSKTTIAKSDFINNSSSTVGGAIATRSNASGDTSSLTVTGSNFNGNTASQNGGAIASYTTATITDTSFVNNSAGNKGGAIWANGDVTVNAENTDVVFLNNSAKDGGDIYMDNLSQSGETGNLKLNAGQDKNITFTDGISGSKQYNVTVDGPGAITFNGKIKNALMNVTSGTLNLAQGSSLEEGTNINISNAALNTQDGKINNYSDKIKIGDGTKLKFDLSLGNKTTDKFSAAEGLKGGTVTVEDFNYIVDTKLSSDNMTVSEIKDSLGLGEEVVLELPEKSFTELTPLRWLNGQSNKNGISYSPTGNSYKDFNKSVTPGPVAAQLGGYLTQLQSYDEAFRNMDMYMIMPKSMRQAMKYGNKYAAAETDIDLAYEKSGAPYDNTALWARPYATFENVRLKRGPKVSNVAWGTYIGGETQLFDLGHGWDGMWEIYAGYNGSHQAYDGISIYQNGGTLGLTGTLYKNNFFTGLTANVGANSAEASTNYGDDSFGLFRTGVASKTGYNIEFADGRFIVQPSWLMSYTFVNTEDYTTSGGIKIKPSSLNALQLEPGLKFIGNVGKGWQPYTGLSIVWNLFDKTDFMASDATLPEMSVKPFFKYGIGLRRLYGERFVGFGQTYFTSGGRNGVGLQFGGRWTI